MEMTACTVCGKIFGASSGKVCPACGKLLDMVYEKARAYLRDHPHADMHARDLAKAIKEDEKLVEMLMIEGRFDRREDSGSDEDKKKMKLLEELQKNLSVPSQKESAASTYGSDRHGAGKDR
ncbi:MAG: zinc ribbon domain-containing protein [Synergistaceae bacterium]|nr:zinc ribbon domain-containing protein [Synergistaceae bacterium]